MSLLYNARLLHSNQSLSIPNIPPFLAVYTVAHLALPQCLVEALAQRDVVLCLRALEELLHLQLARTALHLLLLLRIGCSWRSRSQLLLLLAPPTTAHHRPSNRVTDSRPHSYTRRSCGHLSKHAGLSWLSDGRWSSCSRRGWRSGGSSRRHI